MKYFLVSCCLYFILMLIKERYGLHMLQQNEYNVNNRYIKWIDSNFGKIFCFWDLLLFVFMPIAYFLKTPTLVSVVFQILLIFLIIMYVIESVKHKRRVKKPLVYTSRIKRLIVTLIILDIIPILIFIDIFDMDKINIYNIILILIIYFSYFIVFISNIINIPVEKLVYIYYKKKTINNLNSFNNLEVIGITGSYGKTSSKNILNDILSVKYNVVPTPKNWNTPFGLMKTINEGYIDKFDDIFIAEMGAYAVGDIKKLCDLVHPKYGIITKIGTAHLESMGSEDNIIKCKFELIESLPSDGVAILNKDDEKQVNYKLKNKVKTIWIGVNSKDADFVASNIKISRDGMSFDCVINGKKVKFKTKLLGIPNIYNILAGIAIGNYMGIDNDNLVKAVSMVKPVEHRLELKPSYDITYIDDAYSSNPDGAKMALDVLSLMDGKKIIMTPGMIELGDEQEHYNKEFGRQIAKTCDIVILVGKKQTKPIYDGLLESKFDKKKIYVIDDVKKGFDIINKIKDNNTFVLLENDLPDLFNE